MENEEVIIEIGDYRFCVFEDTAGKWRWHCKSANNENVCTSGEDFYSNSNAERAVLNFVIYLQTAK